MTVQRFNFTEFGQATVPAGVKAKPSFVASRKTPKEEDVPLPALPVITEEDVKAAEREGYKKGFLEGSKEGHAQAQGEQAEVDRKLVAASEQFVHKLAPLFEDYARTVVELREQLPRVAMAVARKVAGPALDDNALAAVEDMAMRCCETMAGEPKLTITVNETLADALQRRIEPLAKKLPDAVEIVILRDPSIALADCRIEWQHGGVERNTEQLWQQVDQVIADMSVVARKDAEAQALPLLASVGMDDGMPAPQQAASEVITPDETKPSE